MSAARPTRCRWCRAPLEQAATGRPKQFCTDQHRRLFGDVMRSLEPRERPPAGAPPFHSPDAERRLRALRCELRSLVPRCYELANEFERSWDLLEFHRFAGVGADLERSLARHFGDEDDAA